MTIRIRTITPEESEILDQWQRCDDVFRYRRARILRLAERGWHSEPIAEALGLHVETVRQVIKNFNTEGISAVTPRPRSGGRPSNCTSAVAEQARELVRQKPPEETGRATWTLSQLGDHLCARVGHLSSVSHETVRRWFQQLEITYHRSKGWVTSPDPHYSLRKHQRDRLLRIARQAPDGAFVWLDESWFVRWPYSFRSWAAKDKTLIAPQRWNEEVDTIALFAALDDDSQQALLYWADKRPNSEETIISLEKLTTYYAAQRKRFIVLAWDKAPWHTSHQVRGWIRAYNHKAKQEGLPRLLVVYHPTRSPWLMPLEPIFGWVKHQILGGQVFDTLPDLQHAVELAFQQRVAQAKQRHDKTVSEFLAAAAQKSGSVS